jgi:hypothetical protein
MLDPKYKNTHLVITYLGHEAISTLVADYDEQLLLLLLLETYKNLLPNRGDCLDEYASLVDSHDLFEQTNTIVVPTRTLYVENLVRSIDILLMQKLVRVL